jgi:hypothetical protein
MAGVGSTNAMKKGSGNNPFLAFSVADMRSYLNSAYTGCIVKYTGSSTKVEVGTSDKNKNAQNLVFDIANPFTRPGRGLVRYAMKIDKMTNDGVKTTYICHKWINKSTGRLQNSLGSLDESEYWVYALIEIDDINLDNIKGNNVKFLAVTESLSEIPSLIDLHQDWPTTKGINGWQTNCINEAGKITLWSYSEDVKYSYAEGSSVSLDEMIYYEPYVVNELYKVVYGNGQYYFEEFYYISDDVTTATVEDVAPGKTFYDFTGTKQTGIGTKINPYIAKTLDELKSYLTSAYKGAFVKYIGSTVSDTDDTKYYEDSIYQVVDDGTTSTYVILPTLSNPGTAADLAQGKQLIDGEGKVVEGEAVNPEGKLAMDLFAKTITDINDTQGSITSWPALYYTNMSYRAAFCINCKQLSRVNLPNLSSSSGAIIPSMAFYGCTNLKYVDIGYFTGIHSSAFIGCTNLREIKGLENVTYLASSAFVNAKFVQDDEFVLPKFSKLTNINAYYAFSGAELFDITDETFPAITYISGYSTFYHTKNITKLSLTNLETLSGYYTFEYCQNLQEINCPKLLRIFGQDCFRGCRKLSSVNMPAISFIGSGAFHGCSAIKDISLPAVTTLSEYAFRYCSFSKIVLPSLSKMNGDPFRDCRTLLSVYLPNSVVCSVAGGIFEYTPMRSLYSEVGYKYGSIYVPMSLLSQYQSASYWSNLSSRMVGLTDEEFASVLT